MALKPRPATTPMGRSLELGLEVTVSVVLGVALGYYADRWLGTEPLLLIVFLVLGFANALRIVVRFAASQLQAQSDADDGGSGEPGE